MKFILGKKIGMTQMFDSKGKIIPVTLIEAGPCVVLQKKSIEKEGYESLQLGFGKIVKKSKMKKSAKGKEYRYVKEARIRQNAGAPKQEMAGEVGDEINLSMFTEGDKVTVSGVSKGKGFQGGVKRHGFHGRNATHGAKHEARTIGSIGQRFPQHVIKGRKMPGRMGTDRVTVKNLMIAKIDAATNTLALMGAIPGHKGTLLEIKG